MREAAAELARRLARSAEGVCRTYLSNGRREGRYWRVGDVDNTPGRSLYVRLFGPEAGKGAAGKWTDAATGEHGDLLDLIARACRLETFEDLLQEVRCYLNLPRSETPAQHAARPPAASGSPDSARRLFASARPIRGTIAEAYLCSRGITDIRQLSALRFHPRCYHRPHHEAACEAWPALLAAVTDPRGTITGVQRTWLARDGSAKAPLATPRRALGRLLGNGVRFGSAAPAPAKAGVMAVGEGLETMLSLRAILPDFPIIAALSASHLAALVMPPELRRLYVARDNDAAGRRAAEALVSRAASAGIDARVLVPDGDDFNTDLMARGPHTLATSLRAQLTPEDAVRFLDPRHRAAWRTRRSSRWRTARVRSSPRPVCRARPP